MDSQPWLLAAVIIVTLIVVSCVMVVGWAWRSPLILIGMGLRATGQWTSRPRTNVSFPVPNEEDDDYLETRSYA
jgi:hypothetical protein